MYGQLNYYHQDNHESKDLIIQILISNLSKEYYHKNFKIILKRIFLTVFFTYGCMELTVYVLNSLKLYQTLIRELIKIRMIT